MFLAGDLAVCHGSDAASRVIRWGTASPFGPRGLRVGPSHVALIAETRSHGLLWFESTSLCRQPCALSGAERRGAQAHAIMPRVEDYTCAGGRVDVYRLAPFWALSAAESFELTALLMMAVDLQLHYDLAGALLSGTRILKFSRFLYADLDAVFCSELVAAALQKIGLMPHENPMRFNPATLMRRLVRTGVYRRHMTHFRGGCSYEAAAGGSMAREARRCEG